MRLFRREVGQPLQVRIFRPVGRAVVPVAVQAVLAAETVAGCAHVAVIGRPVRHLAVLDDDPAAVVTVHAGVCAGRAFETGDVLQRGLDIACLR